MSMTPEQQRKKSLAMAESSYHANSNPFKTDFRMESPADKYQRRDLDDMENIKGKDYDRMINGHHVGEKGKNVEFA
jgi:nicotinamide riboside kinase